MEVIYEDDSQQPLLIYLTEEIEAETLLMSVGRLLKDAELDASTRTAPLDFNAYYEGQFIAETFVGNLVKGVRVLFPKRDFYLSRIALNNFTTLFDSSVARNTYKKTAAELGIKSEDFVNRVITAQRMLKIIPKIDE
jgi:hypothetical protein